MKSVLTFMSYMVVFGIGLIVGYVRCYQDMWKKAHGVRTFKEYRKRERQ